MVFNNINSRDKAWSKPSGITECTGKRATSLWVPRNLFTCSDGYLGLGTAGQPVSLNSKEGTRPVVLPLYQVIMNMTLQREIHILDLCTRQTEAGCQILRGDLGMTKGPTPGDLGKQVSSIVLPLEAGLRPLSLVARQCEESWRGYSAVLGCPGSLVPPSLLHCPIS